MPQRFAIKRLSAVEVDAHSSNQHEFNADRLRKELGFPIGTSRGGLGVLFYSDNASAPVVIGGGFTLYDARENHPTRSEYRLYYDSRELVRYGQAGDVLALYREPEGNELRGVMARPGTDAEARLMAAFATGLPEGIDALSFVTPAPESSSTARELAQTLLPLDVEPDLAQAARAHPLFQESVDARSLPPTKMMSVAGREISETIWGESFDPDDFILRALEAESELFFEIEREVGMSSLEEIRQGDTIDLDTVLSWAMSIQQSRKSRRGQSLQHHLAALLDREGIPHKAQCETEPGVTPDFIVPGHEAYHNPEYPQERLRLIACKTRLRERWTQISREAARIKSKYLLTLDGDLTPDVLSAMDAANITVFMPRRIIAENYQQAVAEKILGVEELIRELKQVL